MMMRYPQYILAVPLLAVLAFAGYGIAMGTMTTTSNRLRDSIAK